MSHQFDACGIAEKQLDSYTSIDWKVKAGTKIDVFGGWCPVSIVRATLTSVACGLFLPHQLDFAVAASVSPRSSDEGAAKIGVRVL